MAQDLVDLDIGSYRIESRLGRGHASTVYVATSSRDRQRYAFKILDQANANDDRLLKQLVMAIESPHVVKIHDYGHHDGLPWLVRELVIGRSLEDALRDGARLGASELDDLAGQALAGLAAYQANGLVHGALRPSNILLTDDLTVRLCDPSVHADAAQHHPDDAWWLAPEVLAGAGASHLSDQYSLAAVLHRALTGRTLDAAVARWSGREPGHAITLIDRMLSPEPKDRFASHAACIAAWGEATTVRQAAAAGGARAAPAGAPAPAAAAIGSTTASAPAMKSARVGGRGAVGQGQRIEAATRRIDEAIEDANRALAAQDLDAAGGHAERAQAILATLAGDLPPTVAERVVAIRSRVAAARKAAPRRGSWRDWFRRS